MWALKFLAILALVLSGEARPKKFHGIRQKVPAAEDEYPRLSTDVLPTHYDLSLTIASEEDFESGKYSGTVAITIVVNKGLKSFDLHARDLTIKDDITITNIDDGSSVCGKVTASDSDPKTNRVTIACDKDIEGQKVYTLTINFDGELSSTEMSGFYLSTYLDQDKKTKKYLATTQFEEFGARKAFPSFDEPAIKASFTITIKNPTGYNAKSNAPIDTDNTPTEPVDGLVTTVFKTTPQMSTYLVAFIVSEFDCTPGANVGDSDIITEVCSRVETKSTRALAVDTAPKSLQAMKDFTGLDYAKMGVGKMSQAAIPDFSAGAMENWGMVTYREADILNDETESSNYYKQAVVTVITHELSHQWFGDYVTLNWWSDIFLNEGFATYFEYHASDKIKADWELTKQFVLEQLQTVLLTDSTGNTYPLHYNSTDPDVIDDRFDDISYNKGGSILRMLQHFLGIDTFKEGLHSYLQKGPIGQPENLWASFQEVLSTDQADALPATVPEIMDNWVNKKGYPILTVTLSEDGKNVTISQTQFVLSGVTADATKWYVPITYSTNKSSDFTDTTTKVWLTPDKDLTIDLQGADWIILNNQQVGYYRVKYDDKLFDKISNVLTTNIDTIDEISRSHIVDDQLNLARAGQKTYGDVLKFLGSFLKNEKSYYVWYPTFRGFNYLLQKTDNKEVKDALNSLVKELIDTYAKSVPISSLKPNEQIYTLNQVQALTWECKVNYGSCITDIKGQFDNYKSDKGLNANLKSVVYCNALRNSEKAEDDYNFLWNKYNETTLATEKVEILKAMGCVNDANLRKKYLAEALGNNVRLQDASYVFSSVYSNNPTGVDDVLEFIASNSSDFEPHFQRQSTLLNLIYTVASLVTNQGQLDKLSALAKQEELDASIKDAATAAIVTANNSLTTVTNLESTLRDYFNLDDHSSAVINNYHFVNLALIFVVYLWFNY